MALDPQIQKNARKSKIVLIITLVTMAFEIYFGIVTGSMALLADGWHMATHAAALGIAFLAYRLASHPEMAKNFNFGGGKIIALGGFASSVILLGTVVLIGFESTTRLFNPRSIRFTDALIVAVIGLVVNLICAYILHEKAEPHTHSHGGHDHNAHSHDHNEHDHKHDHRHGHSHGHDHAAHHGRSHAHHHGHGHGDHNIRGAYIHVIADALTSVGAIIALLGGLYFNWTFLDPLIGIIGALVILKWAISLIRDTGWELLDGHAREVDFNKLKNRIESSGAEIIDLHVWRVAPRVLACELVVSSKNSKGIPFFRAILEGEFHIQHAVIEERS